MYRIILISHKIEEDVYISVRILISEILVQFIAYRPRCAFDDGTF